MRATDKLDAFTDIHNAETYDFSFSDIAQHAMCPEMHRRAKSEGEATEAFMTAPLIAGSAIHKAIEVWERPNIYAQNPSVYEDSSALPELGDMAKTAMTTILGSFPGDISDIKYFGNQDVRWFLDTGLLNFAKNYLNMRAAECRKIKFLPGVWDPTNGENAEVEEPSGIELPFFHEFEGFRILGVADGLMHEQSTGKVVLRDIKTGPIKPWHAMQLEFYRYLLKMHYGMNAHYGSLVSLKGKEATKQVVRFQLSDSAVESLIRGYTASVKAETQAYTGPFTGACEFCDFRASCDFSKVRVRGSS